MEPIHMTRQKTFMLAHEDVIGNMLDNVITNILDRLPLQDAVRTGVLSKAWRFKWTLLISQLVFDEDFFIYLRRTNAENDDQVRVISRILFQLRGAITKFVLYVDDELDVKDEDIIHWISFLSGKGIKDFTLVCHKFLGEPPFKLPTHFFSCLELKHLKLINCCFNPPPTFHGFPNLLSLELIEGVSNKRFSIAFRCLKALSLPFIDLCNGMKLSCAFELIRSCPNLQTLEIIADKCVATSPPKVDCNTTGLLQLQSVFFYCLKGSENELCLIKYLLASSPVLKTLVMRLSTYSIEAEEKFKFASELLKLHRSSPIVDIKLS